MHCCASALGQQNEKLLSLSPVEFHKIHVFYRSHIRAHSLQEYVATKNAHLINWYVSRITSQTQ